MVRRAFAAARRTTGLACAAAAAVTAALVVAPGVAAADPNDLALNRLSFYDDTPEDPVNGRYRFNLGCGTAGTMYAQCAPDNQLFANLVNQLGGALAPALMAPAGTIGYNSIYFGYEHSISNIADDAEYWRRGTLGRPATPGMPGDIINGLRERVPLQLFVSRLHVRKAFPYGFELGLQASYVHDSGLYALGLDIRWALFEGFRTGVGYLPDFALRASVNTLVGNPQLFLTVVGADASISKAFTISGMQTLTPYLGAQALFIFGDSSVIDATPQRSSFEECTRRSTEFTRDAMGNPVGSGLTCNSGTNMPMVGPNDSRNDMVFMPTRVLRGRGFLGLRYRIGPFTATGEFAIDVLDPQWLNGADSAAGRGRPQDNGRTPTPVSLDTSFRQWMISFGVGVTF